VNDYRDPSGRTLADYARPSLAVDVALLTLHPSHGLAVLLHRAEEGFGSGQWSLPGTFVRLEETLREAALRALEVKADVRGRTPQQLKVFDALDRDVRGRVVSVAHVDVVPEGVLAEEVLAPIRGERAVGHDGQKHLPFDHDLIVVEAVRWIRNAYTEAPDPYGLLGQTFSMYELRKVHERVLGEELQKDTFRRKMLDQLSDAREVSTGRVGKPARLFTRR
jgi:8-oxo-dGTP diphosphatase